MDCVYVVLYDVCTLYYIAVIHKKEGRFAWREKTQKMDVS